MLNCCVFMGRLVHTPELKATPQGTKVCRFSIAVERSRKDQNGERQTDFIDCVAWEEKGVFVSNYFTKGQMIAVQGQLQIREYQGRDGSRKKAHELIVDQASFCGDRGSRPDASHDPTEGEFAAPPPPPKPAFQPQQQSMFHGKRAQEMSAHAQGFEEISGDDDLPF